MKFWLTVYYKEMYVCVRMFTYALYVFFSLFTPVGPLGTPWANHTAAFHEKMWQCPNAKVF